MFISMIVSIALFSAVSLSMEFIGMLSLGELFLYVLMAMPVFLYAKSNKVWISFYFTIATLVMAARLPYVRYIAGKMGGDIIVPVTINHPIIRQAIGVTFVLGMLIYVCCVLAVTSLLIKKDVEGAKTPNMLGSKATVRMRDFFGSTVGMYIISILIASFVYGMTQFVLNTVVFILVAVMLQCVHCMYYRGSIKNWKENYEKQQKAMNSAFESMGKNKDEILEFEE